MPSLRRSLGLPRLAAVMLAAVVLAPAAGVQSMDRARQLLDGAKFAAAKTEFLAVQKANGRNAAVASYLGRIAKIENDGDEAGSSTPRSSRMPMPSTTSGAA